MGDNEGRKKPLEDRIVVMCAAGAPKTQVIRPVAAEYLLQYLRHDEDSEEDHGRDDG